MSLADRITFRGFMLFMTAWALAFIVFGVVFELWWTLFVQVPAASAYALMAWRA